MRSDIIRFDKRYYQIRAFLMKLNNHNFPYSRWDWMITHSYLNKEQLPKIGLWKEDGEVVAMATFDTQVDGNAFLLYHNAHKQVVPEMISYATEHLSHNGTIRILISDQDEYLQSVAYQMDFRATSNSDRDSVFYLQDADLQYQLPEGFRITDMGEAPLYEKFGRVMWKGFNHELDGEGPYVPTDKEIEDLRLSFERPNVDPMLKVAVVAPNGEFAAFCGMWQEEGSPYAYVEPVATDPMYRRMGLGRAVVYEAMRRCYLRGAEKAFVGSSQPFYYQIGFRPFQTATFWERPATQVQMKWSHVKI